MTDTADAAGRTEAADASDVDAAGGRGANTWHGPDSTLLRHAARVPDRTAVAVGRTSLTWRELDGASAALAARLTAVGVRPGRIVVLYRRQGVETVVGMVAAARIGAAWSVVEPGHPVVTLRALLDDVDCGAVVFDPADPATPAHAVRRLLSDGRDAAPALLEAGAGATVGAGEVQGGAVRVPGSSPAYVISTSGTTGRPKAVIVSADNLITMLASRAHHDHAPGPVAFSAMRFAWDGALLLTLWALWSGGTAVLPGPDELADAEATARLIAARRVTHLAVTPSFYRLVLPRAAGFDSHLRLVVAAGEPLPVPVVERHRALLPGVELRNEYGPTEVTITCVAHPVRGPLAPPVPIGRPTGGCTAYVLDGRLHPVARGVVGELYVGGPQVAAGYARRPGPTSARFVADPFADRPGARMYRTGDLVLTNEGGELEFHGRSDGQVKVRGVRLERGAVTAALESHPAVAQAVVLPVPDDHGGTALVAFWTPAEGAAVLPGVRELLAHCAPLLVAEAVPERFVAVGGFPLGRTGKVDEAALRALLPPAAAPTATDGRQRWTPLQRSLAELWAAVLQHDDFGLDDVFFDVGGNSRRVVDLHLRLERDWPGALRVGQLFDLPTVAAQAKALEAAGDRAPAAAPEPHPRTDAQDAGPRSDGPVLFEI